MIRSMSPLVADAVGVEVGVWVVVLVGAGVSVFVALGEIVEVLLGVLVAPGSLVGVEEPGLCEGVTTGGVVGVRVAAAVAVEVGVSVLCRWRVTRGAVNVPGPVTSSVIDSEA